MPSVSAAKAFNGPAPRPPDLPRYMSGGVSNPLGARALYLGTSEYRIHGSKRLKIKAPVQRLTTHPAVEKAQAEVRIDCVTGKPEVLGLTRN
jgi:hypothetical protein